MRVLHRLEDAFNDEAGCAVASRMSFEQRSTNIEGALASVVEAMSMRAGQLKDVTSPRQLVFVVSDGRFDSGLRSKVKQWTGVQQPHARFPQKLTLFMKLWRKKRASWSPVLSWSQLVASRYWTFAK